MDVRTVHAEAERDMANVGHLREWLADELHKTTGVPDECIQLAAVAASELITNVLRHTSSPLRLTARISDSSVRIEVTDDESGAAPVMRPLDPTRIGGNGIRIIDAIASDWGWDPVPGGGKKVWCTLSW